MVLYEKRYRSSKLSDHQIHDLKIWRGDNEEVVSFSYSIKNGRQIDILINRAQEGGVTVQISPDSEGARRTLWIARRELRRALRNAGVKFYG